jgi:hypothetical protein
MDPLERARAMAREAEEIHRAEKRARQETWRRLDALRRFCAANHIDFELIRTEAKGHGPKQEAAAAS